MTALPGCLSHPTGAGSSTVERVIETEVQDPGLYMDGSQVSADVEAAALAVWKANGKQVLSFHIHDPKEILMDALKGVRHNVLQTAAL